VDQILNNIEREQRSQAGLVSVVLEKRKSIIEAAGPAFTTYRCSIIAFSPAVSAIFNRCLASFLPGIGAITPESCPSQINPPAPQHCPKRAVLRTGIYQVRSPRTLKMTCENEQPSPEKRLPIAPYSVSIGQILSLLLATSSKPYVA